MQVFGRLRRALCCPDKVKPAQKQRNLSEHRVSPVIPPSTTSENGCGQQVHKHEEYIHDLPLPSMLLDPEEEPLLLPFPHGEHMFEGAWQVADDADFHLYFSQQLSAVIIKGSTMTTACDALEIDFGTEPDIICFGDGHMKLESEKVLRLSNGTGHHAMFKRVHVPDQSTLYDLQGHWTCYDHARCRVKRTLTIHGAFWHVASKHQSITVLLHIRNGTVFLGQSSIHINSCGILQRRGFSGALWNFVRQHPRILSTVLEA